jgi:quercetin dioxygenase-like cupin family protein
MNIRRVMTAVVDGEARFVSDDMIESRSPPLVGNEIIRIWGFDEVPTLPIPPTELSPAAAFYPPPGGIRTAIWTLPGSVRSAGEESGPSVDDPVEARRQTDEIVPGMMDIEFADDGTHTTDTIDVQYILAGKATLTIRDDTKVFSAGDIVVVNGCEHSWANDFEETCVLLATFIGVGSQ